MGKLSTYERNALPRSAFALPKTREYPMHDLEHAEKALQLSGGKPEEAAVRAAVHKRWPNVGAGS